MTTLRAVKGSLPAGDVRDQADDAVWKSFDMAVYAILTDRLEVNGTDTLLNQLLVEALSDLNSATEPDRLCQRLQSRLTTLVAIESHRNMVWSYLSSRVEDNVVGNPRSAATLLLLLADLIRADASHVLSSRAPDFNLESHSRRAIRIHRWVKRMATMSKDCAHLAGKLAELAPSTGHAEPLFLAICDLLSAPAKPFNVKSRLGVVTIATGGEKGPLLEKTTELFRELLPANARGLSKQQHKARLEALAGVPVRHLVAAGARGSVHLDEGRNAMAALLTMLEDCIKARDKETATFISSQLRDALESGILGDRYGPRRNAHLAARTYLLQRCADRLAKVQARWLEWVGDDAYMYGINPVHWLHEFYTSPFEARFIAALERHYKEPPTDLPRPLIYDPMSEWRWTRYRPDAYLMVLLQRWNRAWRLDHYRDPKYPDLDRLREVSRVREQLAQQARSMSGADGDGAWGSLFTWSQAAQSWLDLTAEYSDGDPTRMLDVPVEEEATSLVDGLRRFGRDPDGTDGADRPSRVGSPNEWARAFGWTPPLDAMFGDKLTVRELPEHSYYVVHATRAPEDPVVVLVQERDRSVWVLPYEERLETDELERQRTDFDIPGADTYLIPPINDHAFGPWVLCRTCWGVTALLELSLRCPGCDNSGRNQRLKPIAEYAVWQEIAPVTAEPPVREVSFSVSTLCMTAVDAFVRTEEARHELANQSPPTDNGQHPDPIQPPEGP